MGKSKYTCEKTACIVTYEAGVDLHHVKTRKSGGTDDSWNLMPLKHELHQECHQIGLGTFSRRYVQVHNWLIENGWEQCLITHKWFHCLRDSK